MGGTRVVVPYYGHVGFTGTRDGMTIPQILMVQAILTDWRPHCFHHGDCVGADAQAAQIARNLGCWVTGHPPSDSKLRAFFPSDGSRRPKKYHDRNADIVTETDCIIATPKSVKPLTGKLGGTWWTVEYALSVGRSVIRILPDGNLKTLTLDSNER